MVCSTLRRIGIRSAPEWRSPRYHVNLQLQSEGRKSFFLQADKPTQVGLYAQHTRRV